MSAINPPPLKVPERLLALAPSFLQQLLTTVRLLWFNFQQRPVSTLRGTTASAQGGTATIAHGLDSSRIVSVSVVVKPTGSTGRLPGDSTSGYEYSVNFDATNINIVNHASNSSGILSKPLSVFITAEKS